MKQSFCVILIVLFLPLSVFAQNSDLKYYSDYSQGFEGWACSFFIGNFKEIAEELTADEAMELLTGKLVRSLKSVSKLTKNNSWLMKMALNEWECEEGELYSVFCTDSYFSESGLLIFAVIDGKESYKWWAYLVDLNDSDFLNHIFDEDM